MAPESQYPIALQPGFRLDEYRIERLLGSGGFGITYSATDENLDLRVAIKEYLPRAFAMRGADYRVTAATAEDEAVFRWGLERFLDEARMLARFDHPNIVKVKRFLEANGTGYIVSTAAPLPYRQHPRQQLPDASLGCPLQGHPPDRHCGTRRADPGRAERVMSTTRLAADS